MKALKQIGLKLSHIISKSPDFLYNTFRFWINVLDRININIKFLLNRPFLLVYQQGRVASTSIFESLLCMKVPYVLFHVHSLDRTKIKKQRLQGKNRKRIDRNIMVGEVLSQKIPKIISNSKNAKPWKIITVAREPIGLLLSTLFLNAPINFKEFYINGVLDKQLVLERVRKIFIEDDHTGWDFLHWFEEEFSKSLNVDIYNNDFNPKDCYFIIKDGKFDVLILKFEELENSFKKGVSSFLNIGEEQVQLLHSNPHKDTKGMDVYQYVCENLNLPEKICRDIYSCWYVKEFYSPEMIDTLVEKWSE